MVIVPMGGAALHRREEYANDAILRMVGRRAGRTVDADAEHRSGTADVNVRCGLTREARSDRPVVRVGLSPR
jgi:hypothetical protein